MPKTKPDLNALARNDFEQFFIRTLHPDVFLDFLVLCTCEAEMKFVFRCFLIPYEAAPFMGTRNGLFSPEANFYLIAHSRMVREMNLYKMDPQRGWFKDPLAGSTYWLGRFNQWLAAVARSFELLVRKKCVDTKHPEKRIGAASAWGTINHLFGIPENLLCSMMHSLKQEPERRAEMAFYKNSQSPQAARWDYPALDMWLTEIWPLANLCGWTYYELWQLANMKFDHPEKPVFERVDTFAAHCKMDDLSLRISESAQKNNGRPPNGFDPASLLPYSEVALLIEPIWSTLTCQGKESFLFSFIMENPRFSLSSKKP